MKLDRDTLICGVRPVRLKALMRHDRFDTPRAMLLLDMAEPRISETMRQLAEAGWVSWDDDRDGIDHWSSTPRGHRLAASRLIRRFPISHGRALLPKIVEAARTLNANRDASHRITEIILFGSVLTGENDGDAGDIDLVVHVARRKLPKETLAVLIEAEERAMPRHLDFFQRLNRQEEDLKRAIKKVSSKISLHGFSDVEIFSALHRQLYRYDVEQEAEIVPDPEVRIAHRTEKSAPERKAILPPSPKVQGWPTAPNTPVIIEPVEVARLHLAQHLWIKGADARQIGKRLNLSAQSVAAYLASRNEARHDDSAQFDVSLDWMVCQAFEPSRGHVVMVEITKRHDADMTIDCKVVDSGTFEMLADLRMFGASDIWISGRCDLQPLLEPVARAAVRWWTKMRDQFVGLDARLFVLRTPTCVTAQAFGSRRPDFRSLVVPMRDLLKQLLPKPLGRDAWRHSLELVRERGRDQLFHWTGSPRRPGSISTLITRRSEPKTWHAIKAALEPQANLLVAMGDFTLGVEASHIDGVVDAIRNSWTSEDHLSA